MGAVMVVGVFMTVLMQVVMVMRMLVGMRVRVIVGMGMGHAVVGVLVGMGVVILVAVVAGADMVVMQMHKQDAPLSFFLYYTCGKSRCQNIYFSGNIPPWGLQRQKK